MASKLVLSVVSAERRFWSSVTNRHDLCATGRSGSTGVGPSCRCSVGRGLPAAEKFGGAQFVAIRSKPRQQDLRHIGSRRASST
jgi:hypothetical protein